MKRAKINVSKILAEINRRHVIQTFIPGDYTPKLNPSKSGKYVAVSVTFTASSKKQLDEIYLAVNALESVKVCL